MTLLMFYAGLVAGVVGIGLLVRWWMFRFACSECRLNWFGGKIPKPFLWEAKRGESRDVSQDWTEGKGRANNSAEFLSCVDDVAAIVRNIRLGDDPVTVARSIVAHLAHRRGIGPPTINSEATA